MTTSPVFPSTTACYRVYYEDTDAAGVVYYANYLKFAERGRSDWLRDLGLSQTAWREKDGLSILVRRVEADYLAPAKLEDEIEVESHLHELGKVRMTMQQTLRCGPRTLARIIVLLVCVNAEGRPANLPQDFLEKLHDQYRR